MKVIKYEGSKTNEWLLYKYPGNNFTNRTKLIVAPGQVALFIKQGAICDVFKAGGHTLSTENIPLLGKIVNLPFKGETPFTAEVLFVNVTKRMNIRWGTKEPISIIDPKFGVNVDVRAYGTYGTVVSDPEKLISNIVGYFGDDITYDMEDIREKFDSMIMTQIKSKIADEIVSHKESVLDIIRKLDKLSSNLVKPISNIFKDNGIDLNIFNIESINFPKEDMVRIKEALKTKAENEILGIKAKFCSNCGAQVAPGTKFCGECGGEL